MTVSTPTRQFVYADPRQLCIGLHVHLDLQWTEHPFPFSSFKIRTQEQIATLQSLGLERVRISPTRSDTKPLPLPPSPPPVVCAVAEPSAEVLRASQAKRQQLERLATQQARVAKCEHALLTSARVVRSINHNLFASREQVQREAVALIDSMAESMLVDSDVAIHLMAEKVSGEDVYQHVLNVALLSMMLANEMQQPAETVRAIGLGALFHDIGKLDMPDRIVRKLAPHNKAELALLQQHCMLGLDLVKQVALPADALTVLAQHHEMVDGSGYPKQLSAAQISTPAKIVALVNRFDNLCNPNNPDNALTPYEALSTMFGRQRMQFDLTVMMTFVRCLGIYPPGTIVALNVGLLAMVTAVNSTRPLKPTVMVYDPSVPREDAMLVDLEQEPELAITKVLRPQQLTPEVHAYLNPRRRLSYYFDAASQA